MMVTTHDHHTFSKQVRTFAQNKSGSSHKISPELDQAAKQVRIYTHCRATPRTATRCLGPDLFRDGCQEPDLV